ncbi:SDR family NAD(P)-dependent oxidoreductase [Lacticaseibacillus pabuli]|uniref:SDR family NAD(P)-dependent oxidoreductase n=1 Tax=Lacticaseibacillus pabuli TaxID=3025672 RepID=A0ABY7WSJ7_9LACO|nr:SDR family oxidoreductase [Lacticaseibacillus sp. KACC 23028]WDF83142.1 SDR family NAD(P)-dependent oxidoreductase [Lacticaseibacillus sp. KACC 23028]
MTKHIVITGGTSGIGLATALKFAADGNQVTVIGRNPQKTQAVGVKYPELTTVVADMSSVPAIEKAFADIHEQVGTIDVLFVNAGFGNFKPFMDFTEVDFDATINLNYKGAFFTIQAAKPYMTQGSNIVINISWTQLRGLQNSSLYSSSKAALTYLTKALALEFAPDHIRVNAVNPGYTNTEQFNQASIAPARFNAMVARVPEGRFGNASEIANVVAFLASDQASYLNGQAVTIDGGMTAIQSEPEVASNEFD